MSVRKAFIWSFAGQIVSFVAVFGTTVALSRILSPREIGAYTIGLAVVGVLQGLSAFGIGTYVIREHELTRSTLVGAFTLNACISALLALVIAACGFSSSITMGEPMISLILWLLAIVPLIGALEFLPATLLQREMRFQVISIITMARTVASAAVSIGSGLAGASSLSSAYGALTFAVVGAVGFNLAARHHAIIGISFAAWRPMTGFGLKTLSIGGVSVLSMRASDIILGRLLGLTALGYYSRASALSNVLFQNVYGSAARVLLAKLADDDRRGVGLKIAYLRALDIILAVMWPLLAGLAVLAAPAVTNLFGERWIAAALPLSILMIVQLLGLTFAMNHELFVLRDRVGEQMRLEAARSLIGLIAFAYGCTYGLAGAAAGRLADSVIGMLLYLPRLSALSGASGNEIAQLFLRNAAVTLAAVAPAITVMIFYEWSHAAPMGAIIGAVTLGGVLWLTALSLLRHPLDDELRAWRARTWP